MARAPRAVAAPSIWPLPLDYAPGSPRNLSAVSQIAYSVRRSARARRVRVNVHQHASHQAAAVEVVHHERAPERAAEAAISELRPWIERRLDDARRARARAQRSLAARAGTLPYLDESLMLVPQAGRERVHRRGEQLLVPSGDARPALERFY